MPFAIYYHADCLEHDTGPHHPECIERLSEITDALKDCPFADDLRFVEAPLAGDAQLEHAHSPTHIQHIRRLAPSTSPAYLDGDTLMSPGSLQAALRAAGAGCRAVDDVMDGTYTQAFCAVRPPGHHATRDRAMGFCLFNNIAIAAYHALQQYALQRIAVVDVDVHHGNGTEDIVAGDTRIVYISTHQSPLFPGTGTHSAGNCFNLPLPGGTDGASYRRVFSESVTPALDDFAPELLLVSAGFDAHRADPLAGFALSEGDYRWIGEQLAAFAAHHSQGRLIALLEGGYNLDVLGDSVVAFIQGLRNVD